MWNNNKFTDMYKKNIVILGISFIALVLTIPFAGFSQDKLPVREYTNPEDVVTFDRTTSFTRMLDVINEFAQDSYGKVILDRTNQGGNIGISVPPMHWEDALDLILRVKGLVLIENQKFFEIINTQSTSTGTQQGSTQTAAEEGEGPPADISTKEVRINAIFFEGNKRALQEIGVDWSTLSENVPEDLNAFVGSQEGGGGGGGGEGQLPSTTFGDQFVSVNSKGAQSVSQSVFNSLINFGEIGNSGIRVQALFSAFEADNLGEILASPTVKVMDGEEGRIQVGQDFSIKQRDFAGNVTDQFFSVGTILQVTPQIIEQKDTTFIHLTLEAERSSAQPDPVSTIINKQQATTQSLLIDGEATVIAGLYRSEASEVRRGVPILKDLPGWFFGLKYLFGYNSKDYQMRELVILVQASIEPSIPERFAQDNLKDKFEVLGEERQRIRDELIKSEMDSKDLIEEENTSSTESMESANDAERKEEIESSMAETPQQPEQEEEMKETEPKRQQNQNTNLTSDPEVKSEAVPLNFGSGESEQTQEETATKEDAEGSEEMESATTSASGSTSNRAVSGSGTQSQTQKTTESSPYTYYIVAAAFKNEQNAIDYKGKLQGNEFPAVILRNPDSDFYYVAYNQFGQLAQAKLALEDIKQEGQNEGAWIYRTN